MQDILREAISQALHQIDSPLSPDTPLSPSSITLEQPARREHGDLSCNAAMALAKQAQLPPRQLAEQLAEQLTAADIPHVAAIEVAGPGFLNFRLANSWWQSVVTEVVRQGTPNYARLNFGQGVKVNLEFVSANPTGPLHAGHARGAAFGDALARILRRCGFEVATEFYVNDEGNQLELFAASLQAAMDGSPVPEDGYHGDYVAEWAKELGDGSSSEADSDPIDSNPASDLYNLMKQARNHAIAHQEHTLSRLGVSFDRWFFESELVQGGQVQTLLSELTVSNKAYEKDGATWLRVSDYGDNQDRVLVKSNGDLTYLTPDIAYHLNKLERADQLIDIWGADHHDYVMRMRAALAATGAAAERFEVITCQIVRLMRGGSEVKLSKRTGDLISIDELLDDIGADATRFAYLQQTPDSHLSVDLDVLRDNSMDNPVYYVQYAHVRACAIMRQASAANNPAADPELNLLEHERELELMRLLADLPAELRTAATARAPHRIVAWLKELASAFHGFYHDCRVTGDDVSSELTQARLALVKATQVGLAIGLELTGVSAPESM